MYDHITDTRELIRLAQKGVLPADRVKAEIDRRRRVIEKRADDIAAEAVAPIVGLQAAMEYKLQNAQKWAEIEKAAANEQLIKQMADDPESPEIYQALIRINGSPEAVTALLLKAAGLEPPAPAQKPEKRHPWNQCTAPTGWPHAITKPRF